MQLVGWQGGRWGKVLGFEEQRTHRGSAVLCCYSGIWQVWEGVKRSQRGSCGNHSGREKPLSSIFKLLTARQGGGSPGPRRLPRHPTGQSPVKRSGLLRLCPHVLGASGYSCFSHVRSWSSQGPFTSFSQKSNSDICSQY